MESTNLNIRIEKDIKIGDIVSIIKAGDVIPAVLGPKKERRTGEEKEFRMITKCPIWITQSTPEKSKNL